MDLLFIQAQTRMCEKKYSRFLYFPNKFSDRKTGEKGKKLGENN